MKEPLHTNLNLFESVTGDDLRLKTSGSLVTTSAANGTAAGANTGAARAFTRDAGLKIMVGSYKALTKTMTIRWKETGNGAGHTEYVQVCTTNYTPVGNVPASDAVLGRSFWHTDTSIEYVYFGLIDREISAAEFDALTAIVGL